jgi:3-deoxy-D-manno-octulosonic-acid transferase
MARYRKDRRERDADADARRLKAETRQEWPRIANETAVMAHTASVGSMSQLKELLDAFAADEAKTARRRLAGS